MLLQGLTRQRGTEEMCGGTQLLVRVPSLDVELEGVVTGYTIQQVSNVYSL